MIFFILRGKTPEDIAEALNFLKYPAIWGSINQDKPNSFWVLTQVDKTTIQLYKEDFLKRIQGQK